MKIFNKISIFAAALGIILCMPVFTQAMQLSDQSPAQLKKEIAELESTLGKLVDSQAPEQEIEGIQRILARLKHALAQSYESGFEFIEPSKETAEPQFIIYIENTLTGRVDLPLNIEFMESGHKPRTKVIEAGESFKIGKINNIEPGTSIKLTGHGALKGYAVSTHTLTYDDLIEKWRAAKHTDSDPLVINIGTESSTPPYTLSLNYSNVPTVELLAAPEGATNPFMVFKRFIKTYQYLAAELQKREQDKETNVPMREKAFSELEGRDWQSTLIPGSIFPWREAKTAEAVARYVLSLPDNYSAEDVKRAARDLSLKWHPDKVPAGQEKFATAVFRIIKKAEEILNQALRDKKERT